MVQKFAVQRNADHKPCRARKMLKNAPTLAIGGADTAENEPPKVRQVSNKIRRNIGDYLSDGPPNVALDRGLHAEHLDDQPRAVLDDGRRL